jgi:transcriptional regulator with XRE-family HTH domain
MTERSVGRAVRTWRHQRGFSLAQAGELVGFSSAKLSMIENALQPVEQAEVIALGLAYRVKCELWKRIAGRAAGKLPFNVAEDFKEVSAEARVVRAYGADAIPQLLRSRSFMARLDSDRDPLQLEVLVAEVALRQSKGGMILLDVVRLAECGRIDVRVLADRNVEQPRAGGAFAVLSFMHRQHHEVVFVERSQPSSYIEDPVACQLVLRSFETLRQHSALGPQESVDLIAELAEGGQE